MSHRRKTIKYEFTVAALVILLCFVSLIGATFALFTSDPEDGTIGIIATAGEVRVDIVDAENQESLVGKVLKFNTTVENADYLFEPGATMSTQPFLVKNTGGVPIKFSVSVSKNRDETKSEAEWDQYWEEFDEAFEIWVTTDPNSTEKAQKIEQFGDALDVEKTSVPYYLVVRMKETASNDFQNCEFSGIGITVYAVQGNVNPDSENQVGGETGESESDSSESEPIETESTVTEETAPEQVETQPGNAN